MPFRPASILVVAFAVVGAALLMTAPFEPPVYSQPETSGRANSSSGTAIDAPTTVNFPYPAAKSSRRFVDQHGSIYLLKMMSSWAMAQNCSNSEITAALEGLKRLGFNAVTVSPFGVHLNSSFGDRYRNKAGQRFFEGAPYASGFGPAWSSMDFVIQEATRLQMTVVLSQFLSWGSSGTTPDLITAGSANNYIYGKTLAERYVQYPNIVWHVMGDFPWTPGDAVGQQIDAVFHGIRDGDGPVRRLVIAEQHNGLTGYGQFIRGEGGNNGYQWFRQSANTLYNYGGASVELFDAVYEEAGAESYGVIDIEPPYVNAPHYRGDKNQQYRERNYSVFLRGGIGINFGHEKWWPFGVFGIYDGGAGWLGVLNEAPQLHAKHAWSLIDRYVADASWRRDEGRFVVAGIGGGDTKAASGYSTSAAVAYFPTSRPVTVDTTIVGGTKTVRLSWYDPTTGAYAVLSESEPGRAQRPIVFPGSHADGSTDWVLVVEGLGE